MKPGAFIVERQSRSCDRHERLDRSAQSGHLGGAALDVLENEPTVPPALLALPNVMITPHIAFTSDASLRELRTWASEEVVRVLRGGVPKEEE